MASQCLWHMSTLVSFTVATGILLTKHSRIDLRPADAVEAAAGSRRNSTSSRELELPPPIEAPSDMPANGRRASRRMSLMHDIRDVLNPRAMRDASAQERIAALRSVRVQGDDDDVRRRRRLTARLQDVFSVRTFRRGRSPLPPGQDVRDSTASASGL
jgi:hypothetical protein